MSFLLLSYLVVEILTYHECSVMKKPVNVIRYWIARIQWTRPNLRSSWPKQKLRGSSYGLPPLSRRIDFEIITYKQIYLHIYNIMQLWLFYMCERCNWSCLILIVFPNTFCMEIYVKKGGRQWKKSKLRKGRKLYFFFYNFFNKVILFMGVYLEQFYYEIFL